MQNTQVSDDTIGLEEFGRVYSIELLQAVIDHPEEYSWPIENVPQVATKMLTAILQNNFNKESRAIKATCKLLGIKHTYKAIDAYIRS